MELLLGSLGEFSPAGEAPRLCVRDDPRRFASAPGEVQILAARGMALAPRGTEPLSLGISAAASGRAFLVIVKEGGRSRCHHDRALLANFLSPPRRPRLRRSRGPSTLQLLRPQVCEIGGMRNAASKARS